MAWVPGCCGGDGEAAGGVADGARVVGARGSFAGIRAAAASSV